MKRSECSVIDSMNWKMWKRGGNTRKKYSGFEDLSQKLNEKILANFMQKQEQSFKFKLKFTVMKISMFHKHHLFESLRRIYCEEKKSRSKFIRVLRKKNAARQINVEEIQYFPLLIALSSTVLDLL